jgi:hypothetical protein
MEDRVDYDETMVRVAGEMIARAGWDPRTLSDDDMMRVAGAYVRMVAAIVLEVKGLEDVGFVGGGVILAQDPGQC